MELEELGQRIRQQREERQLRQTDIANALQISFQAVSKWERGENAPDIFLFPKLARLLGVSTDWLLSGDHAQRDMIPATVFCTALKEFACISRERSPQELATWMNGLFFSMTEAVLHYQGIPIKYVGDGFLAFFSGVDHEQRAVDAACSIQRSLQNAGLVIALNTGEIFLGQLGHPDYARPDILGETVNTAFMLLPWLAEHSESGIGFPEGLNARLRTPSTAAGTVKLTSRNTLNIFQPAQ